MEIIGGTLEGAIYGGITPLSFDGLQALYRATDGVSFTMGNYVAQWDDLSGKDRHLIPTRQSTGERLPFYGNIQNTTNGLAFGRGDGSGRLVCHADNTFKKFLYDGTKMSVMLVFKVNEVVANTGYALFGTSRTTQVDGQLSITAPTTQLAIRTLGNGATLAINDTGANSISARGYVATIIDFGYDALSPDLHRKSYLRDSSTAETVDTLKSERKFSAVPSNIVTDSNLSVSAGGISLNTQISNNFIYEIIIYNHTGKTASVIQEEHERLHKEYIDPRYPNLYL